MTVLVCMGEEKVNELKDRVVAYPENLAKRMISENLWLSNRWHNRESAFKTKRLAYAI